MFARRFTKKSILALGYCVKYQISVANRSSHFTSEDAQQYSELKQELANKYYDNIQGYMDEKAGFIKDIDLKAAKW